MAYCLDCGVEVEPDFECEECGSPRISSLRDEDDAECGPEDSSDY